MAQEVFTTYEVRPGVIAIDEGLGRFYLVKGEKKALLIDSGYGTGDLEALLKSLYDGPIMLAHTHAHGDHTGGDDLFDEVWAAEREFPLLEELNVPAGKLRALKEGDVIDLGGRKLCVMETPGHTAGSLSFFDAENKLLFSGDNVADVTVYLSMPTADVQQYRGTLARFWTMYPAWETLLGHHGKAEQSIVQLRRMMAITDAYLQDQLKATPVNVWDDVWFDRLDLDGASIYLAQ